MPLTITLAGQKLGFLPSGDVAVIDSTGQQTVQGKWRTAITGTETADNKVRYTLAGNDQVPIQALYSITASNQLQVVLRAPGVPDSAPFAFLGSIEIDDAHHLIYNLTDGSGTALTKAITVYGANFRIEDTTSNLLMDLANGGTLSISGDSGIASLEAAENHVAGFKADDLLHFRASTDNTMDDGTVLTLPAKLSFIGTWDIQNGKLVFLSKVTGDITKPDVHIGFAGQIGAITAGFVYFADSAGTQFAFNIAGQHVWKAGNTTNTFNWQSSLGFSGKKFDAQTDFDLTSLGTAGRSFSINGKLTLQQELGGTTDLNFSLKGQYQWSKNVLKFQADVSDVAGTLSYDLMLEGTFKLDHGTITFNVKFSNSGAATGTSFGLNLNFQGDQTELIKALSFQLQITQTQAGTMINATATIQLQYVKGVGVLRQVASSAKN